jgi:hypothetical protein
VSSNPWPPQASEPDLFAEPIIGWRVWRIQLSDGRYRLCSAMHPTLWQPGEPFRATCPRGSHVVPNEGCRCGIYATSSLPGLAVAGVFNDGVCVLGAIAMWGRVIQHQRGARSSAAYPVRLRLVCGTCLRTKRGAVEAVAVMAGSKDQVALCERHTPDGCSGPSAAEVQAELLDDYRVDLLPMERPAWELHHPVPIEPVLRAIDHRPSALDTARILVRTIRIAITALSVLAAIMLV